MLDSPGLPSTYSREGKDCEWGVSPVKQLLLETLSQLAYFKAVLVGVGVVLTLKRLQDWEWGCWMTLLLPPHKLKTLQAAHSRIRYQTLGNQIWKFATKFRIPKPLPHRYLQPLSLSCLQNGHIFQLMKILANIVYKIILNKLFLKLLLLIKSVSV